MTLFLASTLLVGEHLLASSRGAPVTSLETGHKQEWKLESEVWGKEVVSRKRVCGSPHSSVGTSPAGRFGTGFLFRQGLRET